MSAKIGQASKDIQTPPGLTVSGSASMGNTKYLAPSSEKMIDSKEQHPGIRQPPIFGSTGIVPKTGPMSMDETFHPSLATARKERKRKFRLARKGRK
jgi:hypothetical protein